ncbi:MAG: hypothetical protein ACREDA_11975 [Methylocella sp.]
MLSGGLTAELLPKAVRISGAAAVDVSSGVEAVAPPRAENGGGSTSGGASREIAAAFEK